MFKSKYADIWDHDLTKKQRKALLADSGHNPNLCNRCFEFLPRDVRIDVEFVAQRNKQTSNPKPNHATH